VISLARQFGIGVDTAAHHLINCQWWDKRDMFRNFAPAVTDVVSEDDREHRASDADRIVPLERRGEVLDLASQALALGKITRAKWRELIGVPLEDSWEALLA